MSKRATSYIRVLLILILALGATYGTLALTVYFLAEAVPEEVASANLRSLPTSIGEWTRDGEDQPVGEDVIESWNVTQDNFLMRRYMDDHGNKIDIMLVYKGMDSKGWHTPEMCYRGSGFNVTQSTAKVPYAGREVNVVKLLAENQNTGSEEVALYWFACGKRVETKLLKQQMSMASSKKNEPGYGWAFVRIGGPILSSEEDMMKCIRDFLEQASDPLYEALTGQSNPITVSQDM